ncbi:response regulator [Flavobacterium sp. NRK F10]|uniref:Response regulatory domain-containing protein n=1 Tax=Flavobacterium sediminis TaxID=2201181 RepID=A0A2U8QS97_9FLAO|nr:MULTISPECIES: response regulator [Flavobacterium]AWM13018.1 hypothetical protein DI487_03500 [Flavobacterium sediminis]MCO6174174.1 response regulator [Flavobacterium sp. NRK F10]
MKKTIKKVMIIDDNEFDCYITSALIESINPDIEIMEFNSSKLALEYLMENLEKVDKLPDILFIDIYMPVMDGFEFIQKYNQIPIVLRQKVKLCVTSTTIDDFHVKKMKSDVKVLFASKPISREFLEPLLAK